jgi:deoxyribose-phosphate aldolase
MHVLIKNLAMNVALSLDHTLLKPTATEAQVVELCSQAKEHGFYSVCVNPKWVPLCTLELKHYETKTITVVGFPLGANTTEQKIYETHNAVADGAEEIDMVIDISLALEDKWQELVEETNAIVRAAKGLPVKVILETGYLNNEQIRQAAQACVRAEAHFVKTSTGFGPRGASLEDMAIISRAIEGSSLKIKASGGIRSFADWKKFIDAGASRIGTSSSIEILNAANAH